MKKYLFVFALISLCLWACQEQKNKVKLSEKKQPKATPAPKQNTYSFDSTADVNGCADVSLQKISGDLQYELRVDFELDSVPKEKEIDIAKYAKFVKIYLNKYPKENTYIKGVCDDLIYGTSKTPNKYQALSGNIKITHYDGRFISVLVKNLMLQDSTKQTLLLPKENFEKIMVHWLGG